MKIFRHLLLAVAILTAGAVQAQCHTDAPAKSPKYIFYYIGDGMGMGPVMAAQTYNRVVLGNEQPLLMLRFPVVSWCQTWSASSTTTDSAAAGTALSTGTKTRNGMLGMGPDTTAVYSVATVLHTAGWGVGLTSSVSVDDATPGAFYAHVPNRGMNYEIDCEYARCGYEFLGGPGFRGMRGDKKDEIRSLLEQNGVQIVRGPEGAAAISSRRAILFDANEDNVWDIGYTVDSIDNALTLPLLAQTCLDHLEKNSPENFFMMVEGGNIDHALHANDGGAAIKEIINFNQALQVAYDFYLKHPDETLIVVTADHDTGGMALGNRTIGYKSELQLFNHQRKSKEAFSRRCQAMLRDRRVYTWDDMRQILEEDFGLFSHIHVTPEQEQMLKDKFTATFELRNSEDQKTLYANFDAFSVAVFGLVNEAAGIGFTTTSHTGNPVPLCAIGVGACNFKGLNNNNEIAPTMLRLAGK